MFKGMIKEVILPATLSDDASFKEEIILCIWNMIHLKHLNKVLKR